MKINAIYTRPPDRRRFGVTIYSVPRSEDGEMLCDIVAHGRAEPFTIREDGVEVGWHYATVRADTLSDFSSTENEPLTWEQVICDHHRGGEWTDDIVNGAHDAPGAFMPELAESYRCVLCGKEIDAPVEIPVFVNEDDLLPF